MSKQKNIPTAKSRNTPPKSESAGFPPVVAQIVLTIVASVLILLIIKLPRNQEYWWARVSKYYDEIPQQRKNMNEDQRMQSRHGGNYMIPGIIAKNIKPEDIFLLPPKAYVEKNEKNPNNWSNPYVFYYMNSEVKTCAFANDSLRAKATKALVYDNKGGIQLVELKNDSIRNQIINMYQAK